MSILLKAEDLVCDDGLETLAEPRGAADTVPIPPPPPKHRCQWPEGVLRTPGFHWCGKTRATLGTSLPYCITHARRAREQIHERPTIRVPMMSREQIESVTLYVKAAEPGESACPWCHKAMAYMAEHEIPYTLVELTRAQRQAFYDRLGLVEHLRTVPQTVLTDVEGQEHALGGYSQLKVSGLGWLFSQKGPCPQELSDQPQLELFPYRVKDRPMIGILGRMFRHDAEVRESLAEAGEGSLLPG